MTGGAARALVRHAAPAALLVAVMPCGCATQEPELIDPPNARVVAPSAPAPAPATAPVVTPMNPKPATRFIGQSVEDRPIEMLTFADASSDAGRPVLIIGGIHGSEPTSVDVARALAAVLEAEPAARAGRGVAIVPVANPDGYAARRRTNANGVDVNRNFPAANWRQVRRKLYQSGPEPLSEPEARALHETIESLRPALIISIHSITDGKHCNNYDGPAEPVARLMGRHNGYPVTATMGYPTPGSLGSWAGIDRQIPIVTLELPREQPGHEAWVTNREALLAAIREGVPE